MKAALNEDPGSSKAQNLLDRWLSLLQARTESLPPDVGRETGEGTAEQARERARAARDSSGQ